MRGTILVVEDDRAFRTKVVRYLERLQFKVLEAGGTEQALPLMEQHPVELVILDIGLGKRAALKGKADSKNKSGSSGYALLEMIRSRPGYIAIIVLTFLTEPIYEIAALQRGADDFLLKGIEMETLAARVQCCLHRGQRLNAASKRKFGGTKPSGRGKKPKGDSAFRAGDFHIDSEHRLLRIGGGEYVQLTAQETRLLELMARDSGKVFRKHELLQEVWGDEAKQTYHSVDALVKNVRRKIEPELGKRRYLKSVHGVGYRLNVISQVFEPK
jgi:DNA-binding response OmpR family regulator